MHNSRQLLRRNWGYLVLLVASLAYAMLPNECHNPVNIILQDAGELIDWIATWPEGLK